MAATGFRLSGVTIDCLDTHLVARFWAGLLGGEPRASLPGWYELGERGGPRINFQPVLEPKTAKTRIHLDLTVDDIDRAAGTVVQAGGRARAWLTLVAGGCTCRSAALAPLRL